MPTSAPHSAGQSLRRHTHSLQAESPSPTPPALTGHKASPGGECAQTGTLLTRFTWGGRLEHCRVRGTHPIRVQWEAHTGKALSQPWGLCMAGGGSGQAGAPESTE